MRALFVMAQRFVECGLILLPRSLRDVLQDKDMSHSFLVRNEI